MPAPQSLLPAHLRDFDDANAVRQNIYNGAIEAIKNRPTLEDDNVRLEIKNIRYDGKQDFTLAEQKKALLHDRNLATPLKGMWRLIDKKNNTVIDERDDVLMHVPYWTQRNTLINNGSEYSIINQLRLKPGVYARRKVSGELESHFNTEPGTGKTFRVILEPESGVFNINVGQATIPAHYLIKDIMGASDDEIMKAWGPQIAEANLKKQDKRALDKLYEHFVKKKPKALLGNLDRLGLTQQSFDKTRIDPVVISSTLGLNDKDRVDKDVLLRATSKLIRISKKEEDVDDRDSMRYSTVHSVEDFIKERIEKDAGKTLLNAFNRVKRERSLKRLGRGIMNSYMNSLLFNTGLASPLEETNPLQLLEQANRLTRMGEGGINDPDAVYHSTRNVNSSQLGFIDPIAGPESLVAGSMVMTYAGWRPIEQITLIDKIACLINGKIEYHNPIKLHRYPYTGLLYGAKTKFIEYKVTNNHRLWLRPVDQGLKFRFEFAEAAHNKLARNVLCGGVDPYDGNDNQTIQPFETLPEFNIVDWCEFMGWWLSEGCTHRSGAVSISQVEKANKDKCNKISSCLDRLGFKYTFDGRQFSISVRQFKTAYRSRNSLWQYLIQFGDCYTKYIPEELFNAPVEARKVLLSSLLLGDGRINKSHTSYCTTSRRLADDVQRLAFGLGYSTNMSFEKDDREERYKGCYVVSIHKINERVIVNRSSFKESLKQNQWYTEQVVDIPVYCLTVPGSLFYMKYGDGIGHWTGNSERIGVDVRAAYKTFKGKDNQLYAEFFDPRLKKKVYLNPNDTVSRVMMFPDQVPDKDGMVTAMKDGQVQEVPIKEVDLAIPSLAHMLGSHVNMVPMPTAFQPSRAFYSAKYWSQYLPLKEGEAPLVRSMSPDGKSFSEYYGKKVAGLTSPIDGVVQSVQGDLITIKSQDGQKHTVETIKDFPFNRISAISYYPTVKPGDSINAGDLVAHSNFTDKTGAFSMGRNLKAAVLPYKGYSFQDAYVVSESAAQKLTSERMFGYDQDAKHGVEIDKNKFMALFPQEFKKDVYNKIGKDGVVPVGTIIDPGDPLVLAVGPRTLSTRDAQLGKLHKVLSNSFINKAVTWDHPTPGIVTDAVVTPFGAKVFVKTYAPAQEGDKLSNMAASKGVIGKIIPDDKMPRDPITNEPYEVLLNPMSVLSRMAPNQIIDMQLSKIAKKTGQPYILPQVPPEEGWAAFAANELKKHNLKDTEDIFDPETGKTIKDVSAGYMYTAPFHHIAEKKLTGRSTGAYTCYDDQTEVLTKQGWKRWQDISLDDEFATKNRQNKLVYEKAIKLTKEHYRGRMLGFEGKYLDYCVTPNHKMLTIDKNRREVFRTAEEVHGLHRVLIPQFGFIYEPGSDINSIVIPAAGQPKSKMQKGQGYKDYEISTIDCAQLFGWYIAEGCCVYREDKHEYSVLISQSAKSNSLKLSRIVALANRLPFSWSYTKNRGEISGIKISSKQLARFMKDNVGDYCENKNIPRFLFDQAVDVRYALLFTLIDGDGNRTKDGGFRYTTISRRLADDVQELAIGLGLGAIISTFPERYNIIHGTRYKSQAGYCVSIQPTRKFASIVTHECYNNRKYEIDYDGMVYCATVPSTGLLYVRRNYKPMLCGNSDELPAKGGDEMAHAIKFGDMNLNALLSHSAIDVLKDVLLVRGTKNEDYWKALKYGRPIPEPKAPFVWEKFMNLMKAGGINVTKKGDILSLMPMTDKKVAEMAKDEVENSGLVDYKMNPAPGGLFDVTKTGGPAGTKWSFMKLHEPIPNPIMEEPIRRVLGLTQKQMMDIIIGKSMLNEKTGGEAIKSALSNINIDKAIQENKLKARNLRGSNRDNAVKIIGYLNAAKKQGISPADWVISKVPIIPPIFRPVNVIGGNFNLVNPLNDMYKDMIELNNNIKELKENVPHDQLYEDKKNLYDAVTASYGLGESINPEGRAKRLKGAIRIITGETSKTGFFQDKLLTRPVDEVGRGVITPDPNLGMDEVGLPEEKVWQLYKPFVVRRLVHRGYPSLDAARLFEEKSKVAEEMLHEEIKDRPVIINRDPAWHKFNFMAVYPKMVKGDVLHISPLITAGFNADFDGDTMSFHVPVGEKAVRQAKEKMLPSSNLFKLTTLRDVQAYPDYEMLLGLFQASKPEGNKIPRPFKTAADAKAAYRKGEIDLNDPITILGK